VLQPCEVEQSWLWQAEEHFGKKTPFDSVYKLEQVARKAGRDLAKIDWELKGVIDVSLNMGLCPTQLSIAFLTGKGQGNKGPPCQN